MKGLINNEWDRDNLMFLLKTGEQELNEWYAQADADDLLYAQELLAAYSLELKMQTDELLIEAELERNKFPEAQAVLSRFVL